MKKTIAVLLMVMCVLAFSVAAAADYSNWSIRGQEGKRQQGDYTHVSSFANFKRGLQSQGRLNNYDASDRIATSIKWKAKGADALISDSPTKTVISGIGKVVTIDYNTRTKNTKKDVPVRVTYNKIAGTVKVTSVGNTFVVPVVNRLQ